MNNISLIAAIGKNNELGFENKLIWYLPNDLKYFKKITNNHTIVMGYNTFLSIGRALPNRNNIVLTTKNINIDGVTIYHNIDDMLRNELNINEEVFIIGGASLYKYFYSICNKMYLTCIDANEEADTYFPQINKEEWEKEIIDECNENGINYSHILYKRLKNE